MRVGDVALVKKGTECRWCDEGLILQSTSGKTVQTTDGQTLRRDKIISMSHDTIIATEKIAIKVVTKQHKDKEFFLEITCKRLM